MPPLCELFDNDFKHVNSANWFWLCVGIGVGIAATATLGAWWRSIAARLGRARAVIAGTISVALIGAIAVSLYLLVGRPDGVDGAAVAPHAMNAAASPTSGAPQSMDAVTEQLASRLATQGGSDADWELLAQSYEFLGRTADAANARQHRATVSTIESTTASNASAQLLAQANAERLKRNFSAAQAAYEKVIAQNGMTADAWADYADVLATTRSGASRLSGAPATAIDRALALDPNHPKALWLKASLAHEEQRYSDSLAIWQRLRAVIGDNATDARIIDANIAEARQLAGTVSSNRTSKVSGTIDIDPKLQARVTPGATLFIYAKSDVPGPPLAVHRITVQRWPVAFTLDDSMAMMPDRNLSSVQSVTVEARISQSGQANASAGDLQASGVRVNVRDGKSIRLRIDKEVT